MSASVALQQPWRITFDRAAQVKATLLAVAFVALFLNPLRDITFRWWHEAADWGHGFIIPLFSGYLVYVNWDKLRNAPVTGTWFGLVVMLAGLALYQATVWGPLPFSYVRALAMLVTLSGAVLYLCGLKALPHVAVPLAYLIFAIPLPQNIYFSLTDPLARAAGWVAVLFLRLLPLDDVALQGSKIAFIHNGVPDGLSVADACAGMRAVITLCALGVAIAFATERAWWQRIVMICACPLIAVLSNFVRVIVTCVLYIYVDPKYAQGNWHTGLGCGHAGPGVHGFQRTGGGAEQPGRRGGGRRAASHRAAAVDLPTDMGKMSKTVTATGVRRPAPGSNGERAASRPPRLPSDPPARARLASPRFFVCLALLAGTAAVQYSTAGLLGAYLRKSPVPLKKPLYAADASRLSPAFELHAIQPPVLPKETVEALGTEEYLNWLLVDLGQPADSPLRNARVFVTYYTGKPDLVPHRPEECFVAAGWRLAEAQDETVPVGGVGAPGDRVPVRVCTFEGPSEGRLRAPQQTAAYFFHVNGRYRTARNEVRSVQANLFERYSYYAKIEVSFYGNTGFADAAQTLEGLSRLYPRLLQMLLDDHFQDWEAWSKRHAPGDPGSDQ